VAKQRRSGGDAAGKLAAAAALKVTRGEAGFDRVASRDRDERQMRVAIFCFLFSRLSVVSFAVRSFLSFFQVWIST
jgi:hypothetical protein